MTVAYYNGWRERLLQDYQQGNERVQAAMNFAEPYLPVGGRILDVGCGIGWTSCWLADHGDVTAVDISPVLIRTARELFGASARFIVADISRLILGGHFDTITMFDVYEHIPRDRYQQLHSRLADWLRGTLILTCPTLATQQYARDHEIALQPVDEDITDTDIADLAGAVNGEIVVDHSVSVWRTDDYRHVVIRNG